MQKFIEIFFRAKCLKFSSEEAPLDKVEGFADLLRDWFVVLLPYLDSDGDFFFFFLASEPHTPQPSQFFATAPNYTFERSSCECEVLNQRLVRINDSKSLRKLDTTKLVKHKEYWTSLR